MKRINFTAMFLFAVVLCISNSSIHAQSQPPTHPKNVKSKDRMDMIKKMKLLEVLDLSEEDSDKFLSKYTAYEKKIDEKFESLKVATKDLESSVSKKATDSKAKADKIISLQEELNASIIDKEKGLKSVLNDNDYANYILFEQTFFRNLNNAIMECKGDGNGNGNGNGKKKNKSGDKNK